MLKEIAFGIRNKKFLADSFVILAIPIYYSMPSKIRFKTTSNVSLKKELKEND